MHKKHKIALHALNRALTCFSNDDLKPNNAITICERIDTKLLDFDTERTNYLNQTYGIAFQIDHLPKLTSIDDLLSKINLSTLPKFKTNHEQAYLYLIITSLVIASFTTRYNLSEADWSIRAQSKFLKLQELQRDTDPHEDEFDRVFKPYYPYSLQKASQTMQTLLPHARV